jgi:hypothetical protein
MPNKYDDNTCATRWHDNGYIVQYYGIGDPSPQPQPHPHPDIPFTLPYTYPPTPDLEAFKLLAEQIKKLADAMPGRKKVKKLLNRLAELEKRVAKLEAELDGK